MQINYGTTDQSVEFDSIDADGAGVGLTSADCTIAYRRYLKRRPVAAAVPLTLIDLAAVDDAHADGGLIHVGNGTHRLDLPDAAWATGADEVRLVVTAASIEEAYHERFVLREAPASQATADAIKAKTDLIRSGSVAAVSSVSSSGKITVSEGFDFTDITITEPEAGAWDDAKLAANSFGLYARHSGMDDDLNVTATLNAADAGLRSFSASILRTDLPSRIGQYKYHVYGHFDATSLEPEILKGTFEIERGRLVA